MSQNQPPKPNQPKPSQTRKRSERVAQLDIAPNKYVELFSNLQRGDVLVRVAICLVSVITMWLVTGGWKPPFEYRSYQTPHRDIVASTSFEVADPVQTASARESARRNVECVYDHDDQLLKNRREALKSRLYEIIAAESFETIDKPTWSDFLPSTPAMDPAEPASQAIFVALREALAEDENLEEFEIKFVKAMGDTERNGVLEKVQHELGEGSQTEICVANPSQGELLPRVRIEQVRKVEVLQRIKDRLGENFGETAITNPVFNWVRKNLPTTLSYNKTATEKARQEAQDAVGTVMTPYQAGADVLAEGGVPLASDNIDLLREEHKARVKSMGFGEKTARTASALGMYIALYLLCGVYIYYRRPELISDFRKFMTLQAMAVATVALARACAWDKWQAELLPLMFFAMTLTIAHGQEMALLLSAAICFAVALALGLGLAEFVVYAATLAATILMLRQIRTRTKVIHIGLAAAAVAFFTSLGVGTCMGHGGGPLLIMSLWYALFALLAAMLWYTLLPYIERGLDVLTAARLLELGDVTNQLLQELVRRAPGTYNHSINVASMAEAAADAIGANGLLVRVGAYYHDIGKIMKPQYFAENQSRDANVHQTLLPAMSTLIIIAHVKDGADLARQKNLPKAMVDFILQHHGTTLVEYFYDRASKQSEEDPNAGQVDEVSYRYPGPKPQTREAGVLMLADSVESASRSLQEPAPARIESLVHDIAMKKLLDGQFDECDLTLDELRTVQNSLVKSLTAMYHGRVKYPDQQSA